MKANQGLVITIKLRQNDTNQKCDRNKSHTDINIPNLYEHIITSVVAREHRNRKKIAILLYLSAFMA